MKAKNKKNEIKKSVDFKNKKEVGRLGEDIACIFLQQRGFRIIERNFLRKWGEIDIVAIKDSVLTFIEVKSAVGDLRSGLRGFRPEENVHIQKRRRLQRTIQTYIAQTGCGPCSEFLFHVATVRLDTLRRRAHVELIENIIL